MTTLLADPVETFVGAALAEYRARCAGSGEAERALIEDAIALLTDYRLCGIDAAGFEAMLARMQRGRAPVATLASPPEAVAAELARSWRAHRTPAAAAR
jgi:hypothetical protein